jgi:uncharacterized MAPEG superfamily protein
VAAHQIGNAAQSTIDGLAIAYVVSRVLFGVLYIADKAELRSLAWFAGMIIVAALFVVSA